MSSLDYEELRPLVLETIKRLQDHPSLQLATILDTTESYARGLGFYADVRPWRRYGDITEHSMPKTDREKVRQIVWEYILQGILTIGLNETNPNFPFVRVTEYGNQVLLSGKILPHDPDGYLSYLKTEIPNLDSMIELYVTESLQAFLKNLMFSSAVMLGVASERALILLLETLTYAVAEQRKKRQLQKLQKSFSTKRKFDRVKQEIIAIRGQLSRDINDVLETNLDGVFTLIRIARNNAGHPTGRKITRGEAFVRLQLFPHYCKTVYGLLDYLNSNII